MTDPKALAEKICGIVNAPQKYVAEIESLLARTLEERENCVACTIGGMKQAYDRAAEVVDPPCPTPAKCTHMHYDKLAERIRALKGGL